MQDDGVLILKNSIKKPFPKTAVQSSTTAVEATDSIDVQSTPTEELVAQIAQVESQKSEALLRLDGAVEANA